MIVLLDNYHYDKSTKRIAIKRKLGGHMRRKLYLLLALFFIGVSAISTPAKTAHATSAYDTTVLPASVWQVENSGGIPYTASLAQAIDNVSDTQQKTACQTLYSKFMQMDYRYYAVYQPSRYSAESYARAFATDETPGETQWSTSGDMKYAYSLWHNYVSFQLKYENGNVVAFECGNGTNDDYAYMTYAMRWDDGYTAVNPYLAQGFDVDYPSGYAGDSVPSESIGGLITGNVQCANTSNIISAVHINVQSGLDGNAKITDDGLGGKIYRYYLSEESPYSVAVLCDGDTFYGPTVNSDFYHYHNWDCVWTTPGQNPSLGICAAA
jgi:hypothetical protein